MGLGDIVQVEVITIEDYIALDEGLKDPKTWMVIKGCEHSLLANETDWHYLMYSLFDIKYPCVALVLE